jgi:hypothetical protein
MNLAATFATQGLRTVIAGPERAVGPATELLEVQSVPSQPGARLADQLAPSTRLPDLLVLSMGDEVSLGATLRDNGDNLSAILAQVDIIVLDGVNIELPSTSLRLGQIADEAVVVAYKGHSTHAEIERLARQLAQVSVTVLGGILLTRRSGLRGKLGRGGADRASQRPTSGANHRESAQAQPARVEPPPAQAHEAGGPTSDKPAVTPTPDKPAVSPASDTATTVNPASDTAVLGPVTRPSSGGSEPTRPGSSRSASARRN